MLVQRENVRDSGQTQGLTYLRYCPSPPLDRYIHHLYYMDGRMPFPRERILPVPLLDLKINLGSAFHVFGHTPIEQPQRLTESWLVGLYGEYHSIEWPSDMRLYGVRFKPTGVYPFLSMSLSELYNQAGHSMRCGDHLHRSCENGCMPYRP